VPPVGGPRAAQPVSAVRFYCDEDSQNRALLKALRSRGVEVTSAGEAGVSDGAEPGAESRVWEFEGGICGWV
jgi:hypothetical protein